MGTVALIMLGIFGRVRCGYREVDMLTRSISRLMRNRTDRASVYFSRCVVGGGFLGIHPKDIQSYPPHASAFMIYEKGVNISCFPLDAVSGLWFWRSRYF